MSPSNCGCVYTGRLTTYRARSHLISACLPCVQENFDAVGVLLMIRINHEHRNVMAKRHVPCLNHYLDRVHLMLWPRFKLLFDAHLASVRAGSGVAGWGLVCE